MKYKENIFHYPTPDDATGFLLYKTYMLWQRAIRRRLQPMGLTHTQFVIMANCYRLQGTQGVVTQIDIARLAQMDTMMISNVIRKLEGKGLVQREAHRTDTRAKTVALTEEGVTVLKRAVREVEEFDRAYFAKLEDSRRFNRELLRLMADTDTTEQQR
ncbi:MAG: MarR family transcriptional regulator [Calditrichaeota bacterium]|nr:MAG: MarR family transcriptional regulator [Calditrichota bacterium]